MAKETIEAVKKAEEAAMNMEMEAGEECRRLLEAAEEQKKLVLGNLQSKARETSEKTLHEAAREADSIKDAAARAAAAQVTTLETAAKATIPAAVDAVIGLIL